MPRLEETIGEYEMAVVLRSLCTVDGSLFIPTDKASLMRLIEEANPQAQLETPPATGNLHRILVIDAMAVVQGNYNIDNFNNNINKNNNNSNKNNSNKNNNKFVVLEISQIYVEFRRISSKFDEIRYHYFCTVL